MQHSVFWMTMSQKRKKMHYTQQNLRRKMFCLRPKCIFFPAPFILSIIAWTGGYHGDTEGPFLIGCQDEVRVTGESRDQTLPGLILVSPVSPVSTFTFVGLFSLLPQLISTAICYRSLIDSYSNPKYLQLCQHAGFKCGPKKQKQKNKTSNSQENSR